MYRHSDRITAIRIPERDSLLPLVQRLGQALQEENDHLTQRLTQGLADSLTTTLKVPGVRVRVFQVRPSNSRGELHGLYSPRETSRNPEITVWMRTAKRRQVVAFRTFLRTLLHELCHHLDYTLFKLNDSFHTEGFYKRESSLLNQLLHPSTASQPSPLPLARAGGLHGSIADIPHRS